MQVLPPLSLLRAQGGGHASQLALTCTRCMHLHPSTCQASWVLRWQRERQVLMHLSMPCCMLCTLLPWQQLHPHHHHRQGPSQCVMCSLEMRMVTQSSTLGTQAGGGDQEGILEAEEVVVGVAGLQHSHMLLGPSSHLHLHLSRWQCSRRRTLSPPYGQRSLRCIQQAVQQACNPPMPKL
jgi:hypothetical protein